MRLSHKDFVTLQRAVLQLHVFHDLANFRQAVPGIFLKLVAAEFLNYNDFEPTRSANRDKRENSSESNKRLNPEVNAFVERHLMEHPISQYFLKQRILTALKQSDFTTWNQLQNSPWGVNLRRHFDADRIISLALSSDRGAAAIHLMRRSRDFDEWDRLMLNLLQPYYGPASRDIQLMESLMAQCTRLLADYHLSARETEIAALLVEGKSNPEIAIILQANVRTVEKHVERILEKLGVENRTAAAVIITQCRRSAKPTGQRLPQRHGAGKFHRASAVRINEPCLGRP